MSSAFRPGRLSGWTSAAAAGVLALLVLGALCTAVGALLYPGGNWVNPGEPGHSFWRNFLCDLAREMAVNGRPSRSAPWGRAAEWALVLALFLTWWSAPALLPAGSTARGVRALGTASTLGLLAVPVTSELAHLVAILAGALPALLAALLLVRAYGAVRPGLAVLGSVALVLAGVDLVLYVAFRQGPLPALVPALQRLALLAGAAWMAACAVPVLREEPGPAGPSR